MLDLTTVAAIVTYTNIFLNFFSNQFPGLTNIAVAAMYMSDLLSELHWFVLVLSL